MLQVKLAQVSGFCGDGGKFGVSGAIRIAQEAALSDPGKVYLVGDLVHNDHVTKWLEKMYQIKIVKKLEQIPKKSVVVVKAHGAPPDFWQLAQERELRIVDATCPMVKAAQKMVVKLVAEGKHIIYVASAKNHDEAVSVSKQVGKGVKVVTLDELDALVIKNPAQSVVLTQTTLSLLETREKFALLAKKYPDLTIRPHLCAATTDRQNAVLALAQEVDFLVVVGAPHSSNSQRLLEVARSTGRPAQAVNEAKEIDPTWFGAEVFLVGVIAGASTPEWITKDVVKKLSTLPDRHEGVVAATDQAISDEHPPATLVGLGQDSHRLVEADGDEQLMLGGLPFVCGLKAVANSDGDVILHALANGLSTAIGGDSFSQIADPLCAQGITDSRVYLQAVLQQVLDSGYLVVNVSVSVEALQPKLESQSLPLRASIARLLGVARNRVGIAFTTGENLTACGKGEGIACTVLLQLGKRA